MIEVWFKNEKDEWIKTREYTTVYRAFEHVKKVCSTIRKPEDLQKFKLKQR